MRRALASALFSIKAAGQSRFSASRSLLATPS